MNWVSAKDDGWMELGFEDGWVSFNGGNEEDDESTRMMDEEDYG